MAKRTQRGDTEPPVHIHTDSNQLRPCPRGMNPFPEDFINPATKVICTEILKYWNTQGRWWGTQDAALAH